MADNSAEIARLEQILNSGAAAVSVDGLATRYDLTEVRKRLSELKATDDNTLSAGTARPRNATIQLKYF